MTIPVATPTIIDVLHFSVSKKRMSTIMASVTVIMSPRISARNIDAKHTPIIRKNVFHSLDTAIGFSPSGSIIGCGGVEAMQKLRDERSSMLYDFLDGSSIFRGCAEPAARSGMNVTFRAATPELEAEFIRESAAAGFVNLKGHRSVGGMRASIYNAMPVEGVEKLVEFMKDFEVKHHA